ncbi:HTH DNA binding protein [Arthrobacter phage Nubia]|uniref:Helix-turn-helix DNA-binding domain protein n=1 Tax=Arthrobacter phage Nubia TaxID=2015865 RepID=A0A222ZGB4_9CAUD|nr:HTH DNA binding protein [Arthrobacter phage Nubia]ASR83763.1 helix-turn-helix DNA-binding domain protein [Arthrobacter phage Nubia]
MTHIASEKLEQIQDLLDNQLSHTEIAKRLRVSRNTIRYYFPDTSLSREETLARANAARLDGRRIVRPGETEKFDKCLVCGTDRQQQRRWQKQGIGFKCSFGRSHKYAEYVLPDNPDCRRCQGQKSVHHTCQNN